jgi:hypothetical protein
MIEKRAALNVAAKRGDVPRLHGVRTLDGALLLG